ncbi:MAG: hypothetical protein AAFN93_22740 [Bacteroidota bacterium]
MSKRQVRLNSEESITEKLPDISGKKVNIVLQSGEVIFVQITGYSSTTINVLNMRRNKSEIEIKQISEVILDIEA